MKPSSCVIVLLTFNSAAIIRETIGQARKVSNNIFVVDSGSTDGTLDLLSNNGCDVRQREFVSYSDQRNWAMDAVSADFDWQLHLDADEVLDDQAISEILAILKGTALYDAYMLKRRDYFLGQMLRFSGLNPWHVRLFRPAAARCENRLYDQHFVPQSTVGKLGGFMHDKNALTLSEWISRHNRWSDLEVAQILYRANSSGTLKGRILGNPIERTRFYKQLFYHFPDGLRSVLYFFYRYIIRLGFLDGRAGFYFSFFQALWFRVLVDAKLRVARNSPFTDANRPNIDT